MTIVKTGEVNRWPDEGGETINSQTWNPETESFDSQSIFVADGDIIVCESWLNIETGETFSTVRLP
jgi:hypothetical protein